MPRSRYLPGRPAGVLGAVVLAAASPSCAPRATTFEAPPAAEAGSHQATLDRYCSACHNDQLRTADVSFHSLDLLRAAEDAEVWERVITKLRTRTMPPVGSPRPGEEPYDRMAEWLEGAIDASASAAPNPGRTETFHRLNRSEYANAIRDLLALDVDVNELLPPDNFDENGFDNMAEVLTVSPALMDRYLGAARRIARLAVGEVPLGPAAQTYSVNILHTQDDRMGDDLPFGSRGGIGVRHHFPVDGDYDLEIRLHRNYVNYVRGMGTRHELEVRLDGALVRTFGFGGEEPDVLQAPASYAGNQFGDPAWEEYMLFSDSNLRVRFPAAAGPRVVSVSFVRKHTEPEGVLQPRPSVFAVAVDEMRDGYAAVDQATVTGPYEGGGPGDTPSRRAIFTCRPASDAPDDEEICARKILGPLARRAYRRPIEAGDLSTLVDFFRSGRGEGTFEAGVQSALERILLSPDFLFRVERDPADVAPGAVYPVSDLELASRLSFFLWSSLPDEELLALAESGSLQDPDVLQEQTRRMLADSRSGALVRNFAGQWLILRNLQGIVPDPVVFPEFDENLREAFEQETELFVASLIRDDASVLDLLAADYTYANERLAEHYGIPGVYGSHFRRVPLTGELAERRGGILGQGSLLTATSYPNRTSPVLRGKWLLASVLGTPPPPPPADVPDLPDRGEGGVAATVRDRLEMHRENPACAACHAPMDPLGLALENYDATGRWRSEGVGGLPIDASGVLPDGTRFEGPSGLRDLLLQRREQFVGTVTEKLLGYAIGRGPEHYDRPVIREIRRNASFDNYPWSSIIIGIVQSTPFRMRRSRS